LSQPIGTNNESTEDDIVVKKAKVVETAESDAEDSAVGGATPSFIRIFVFTLSLLLIYTYLCPYIVHRYF